MNPLQSWGRLSADLHRIEFLNDVSNINRHISNSAQLGLAHGMGRSYGDVCLNPGQTIWLTRGLDRFISFDENSGIFSCESGVLLRDIQRLVIPRGWILPVTPGTQLVTVGGAIANDVHGKNHHVLGSFGDHVRRLTLIRTNGESIHCGPKEHPEWFTATVGGMGLTGVISRVELQLRRVVSPWLETEITPYENLGEFFNVADHSEVKFEHTVSWIDCISNNGIGRGIFMCGNPTNAPNCPVPREREITVPFVPPISLVNRFSLRPFNAAYYYLKKRHAGRAIMHYEPFFYPLDKLLNWNRIYGPKGFFQYQSVVPREVGKDAVQAMLKEIARFGGGSFLAVLKTFGSRHPVGLMSFPSPGVTLALDFPNRGSISHQLFERLDSIVLEAKGRLYIAKDARMPRAVFEAGYPRLSEFTKYRDPGISSGLSRRLLGA